MKTAEQILEFIEERVGHIYFRPLMYSGNAESLDLILGYYYELWAKISEREAQLSQALEQIRRTEKLGAKSFGFHYGQKHPSASEQEKAEYTVNQWRKIAKQIGMNIPYKKLRGFYEESETLRNKFLEEE